MKTTYRKTCAGNLLMWSDFFFPFIFVIRNITYIHMILTHHNQRDSYYVHPTGGVDILFLLFPPSAVPLGFQTF